MEIYRNGVYINNMWNNYAILKGKISTCNSPPVSRKLRFTVDFGQILSTNRVKIMNLKNIENGGDSSKLRVHIKYAQ